MFQSILHCVIFIAAILKPVVADSILRNDPRLPIHGTKNWAKLDGPGFTPRHSHATCIFKCPDYSKDSCIWLTGGYSESHRAFDAEIMQNENADVWWSKDGETWNQATALHGDFLQGVGNGDAKVGGYTAPWYGRYGHSINALIGNGDGIADAMILTGGFSPLPSNDVWITNDGITWHFDGYAPWPKRAYHGATVFLGKLFILGGSPLSNDVWVGSLVNDTSRNVGYRLIWEQKMSPNEVPWTPRAAFCTVTQRWEELLSKNATTYSEQMFILGGLARDDPLLSEVTRSRNDVWKTTDGVFWERVLSPSGDMPWASRSFHSCVTWQMHLTGDQRMGNNTILISGGGYMGQVGNNEVRKLEAKTDMWFSNDGASWFQINHEEGSISDDNLYSTQEWTESITEGGKKYRGKFGHTLEAFHTSKGMDEDLPALFSIGGKLEDGDMVSDVFVSKRGVHCEINGITCNRNGSCGPGTQGCICHSADLAGEYCS